MRLNSDHEKQKGDIVKALSIASPVRVKRVRESFPTPQKDPIKYTNDCALALFLDLGLSKEKYKILRNSLRNHNVDILPSYNSITISKKEAVPPNCEVTEVSARVKLQDIMDHTARRLLEAKTREQIAALPRYLTLQSKWGCDGSSGQSAYKQKINSLYGETDANMFMASVVPLRLRSSNEEHWRNPRPSSVHFCRPIMFQYAKETGDLITSTVNEIKNEISEIRPTIYKVNEEITLFVNHEFFLTMIDGKVLNELTETKSTRSCPICKRTQKSFNSQDEPNPNIDEHNYQYGISPLHGRIRCMEFILKLAYTLRQDGEDFDESVGTKDAEKRRKQRIQTRFRDQLGLDVDKPKQGFGNTNDGNTSRKFFDQSEITAQITGVSREVISRLKTILDVLNCREVVNSVKFGEYTKATAVLLTQKYPQKQLTPTLHKILVHSQEIIEYQSLPLGELSEEAQESKNKDYKRYRYQNTCKISRTRQNEDLYNMLAASSDPLISSLRHVRTQKDMKALYSPEMLSLLHITPDQDDSFQEI